MQKSAEAIAEACTQLLDNSWSILGPAPASIMKVARRYRWQVLLKNPQSSQQSIPELQDLKIYCRNKVSMTIDVDPMSIS